MNTRIMPILAALAIAAPAGAQVTALTYQGQLLIGGQPASGPHDLQFRLFDAASGGLQVGPTVCLDNVPVTQGLFIATMDFGQPYAASAPRFLEIQVRADTGLDCANTAGMVLLSPRQLLTPAPLAAHAHAASALDAPDGSPTNALFVDNAGRVGVGTTAPQSPLHVRTTGDGVRVQGTSVGNANMARVSFANAAGTEMGYVGDASGADDAIYLASSTGDVDLSPAFAPALTVRSTGNIGVGTTVPGDKLEVRGDIRLGPSGQFRAAAGEENLRVVRRVIGPTGAILNGSGFTAMQTETGKYRVTFSPSFAGLPAITGTVVDSFTEALLTLRSSGPSSVILEAYERDTGAFVDRQVQFMAVGPR